MSDFFFSIGWGVDTTEKRPCKRNKMVLSVWMSPSTSLSAYNSSSKDPWTWEHLPHLPTSQPDFCIWLIHFSVIFKQISAQIQCLYSTPLTYPTSSISEFQHSFSAPIFIVATIKSTSLNCLLIIKSFFPNPSSSFLPWNNPSHLP